MKYIITFLIFFIIIGGVMAIPFTPKSNINMQSYNVTNASYIFANKFYYNNGTELSTSSNNFLPLTGGTLSGSVNMGLYNVTNVTCIIFSANSKICATG